MTIVETLPGNFDSCTNAYQKIHKVLMDKLNKIQLNNSSGASAGRPRRAHSSTVAVERVRVDEGVGVEIRIRPSGIALR